MRFPKPFPGFVRVLEAPERKYTSTINRNKICKEYTSKLTESQDGRQDPSQSCFSRNEACRLFVGEAGMGISVPLHVLPQLIGGMGWYSGENGVGAIRGCTGGGIGAWV